MQVLKAIRVSSMHKEKKAHWFEVHRLIDGNHDAIVSVHRTRKQAEKAVNEAKATGKFEVVYFEEYDEDGIID